MRLLIVPLLATALSAQLRFDLRPVVGQASDRLKEAERRLERVRHVTWRHATAAEELAVVEAILKNYDEYFEPQVDSKPRIATFTDAGKDILVARWAGRGSFQELIVWDSPEDTSFILRLTPRSWSDDAALTATFERLLRRVRPDGTPTRTYGVTLNVAQDPYRKKRIAAGGLLIPYGPRQFDVLLNWLDLWDATTASFLSVSFSQYATRDFPPEARSIRERFPPLSARVPQWTKERLIEELSPNGDARNLILARELVKRDLTREELSGLLESHPLWVGTIVLQELVQAHQVGSFSEVIRKYLRRNGSGPAYLAKYLVPFTIVHDTREANFTDVALEVLREGTGHRGAAFFYAAEHSDAAEDYRTLRELSLHEKGSPFFYKQWLLAMRTRLRLDEDGNPVPVK